MRFASFKWFLGLIALTTCVLAQAATESELEIGKPAPNFTLTDTLGKIHTLSDYQGKYVILEWTNHECPFVRKHYGSGNMQKLQKMYTEQGVVWLSIISSAPAKQGYVSPEQGREISSQDGAAATAKLLDASGEVGRLYDAKTTPHMFIISPEGNLVYMGGIDDKPSANPADIEGATNYVQAAMTELMEGKAVSQPLTRPYGCSVKY